MREFGSLAVSALVSFAFMPFILRQKAARRLAAFGDRFASAAFTGRLMFRPSARRLARPFSFRPPSGFLPSARCHAGDVDISVVAYCRERDGAFPQSRASAHDILRSLGLTCPYTSHFRDAMTHPASSTQLKLQPPLAQNATYQTAQQGDERHLHESLEHALDQNDSPARLASADCPTFPTFRALLPCALSSSRYQTEQTCFGDYAGIS